MKKFYHILLKNGTNVTTRYSIDLKSAGAAIRREFGDQIAQIEPAPDFSQGDWKLREVCDDSTPEGFIISAQDIDIASIWTSKNDLEFRKYNPSETDWANATLIEQSPALFSAAEYAYDLIREMADMVQHEQLSYDPQDCLDRLDFALTAAKRPQVKVEKGELQF